MTIEPTDVHAADRVQGHVLDVSQVRAVYDRGLTAVMQLVPDSPAPGEDPGITWLRELSQFRRRRVLWASLRGGEMIAEDSFDGPATEAAWLVAIPPDHHVFSHQPNVLSVDSTSSVVRLLIKPLKITTEWAGISLVHELEHLENLITGKEPRKPSREQYLQGEVRAYSV